MKVAKIAVSVFNKHQNRTFSELCNKYGIKHIYIQNNASDLYDADYNV